MTDKIEWPKWEDVAAGEPIPGAHVVKWEADPKRHHQRNRARKLVRVEVLPQVCDVAGYLCHSGVNFLLVYEDQVAAIRKLMPNEDLARRLADAEKAYEHALKMHAKSLGLKDMMSPEAAALIMDKARQTFGRTKWSLLSQSINATSDTQQSCREFPGYPPVVRLDVCDAVVPPPMTPQSYAEEQGNKQAEAMGRALAQALPAALAAMGITPKGKSAAA